MKQFKTKALVSALALCQFAAYAQDEQSSEEKK